MGRNSKNILGLMSGSSLDGLDLALCRFGQGVDGSISWEVLDTAMITWSSDIIQRLRDARSLSARELLILDHDFSAYCAQEISSYRETSVHDIDYIASHGHTVYHHPELGFSCQIGSGAVLAAHTGIPAIVDFRSTDVALGGQGAPVAPIVEQYLYPEYSYFLNLGGIANISYHNQEIITSWDSCPFNQILNLLAQRVQLPFDDSGKLASSGSIISDLYTRWSDMDYFSKIGPKSLDNGWVQEIFAAPLDGRTESIEDQLATMCAFAADQIAADISRYTQNAPGTMLITGGGAHNTHFIQLLQDRLTPHDISVEIPDPQTINYKESILMALMGYLRVIQVPNTIPTVTGARRPSIGGAIYLP